LFFPKTKTVADTSRLETKISPNQDGLSHPSHPAVVSDLAADRVPKAVTDPSSSDTKTTTDLLANNNLQRGAQVVLTPGMIPRLSGNPLLRAGLREIGLA
jgi:hypothetical protein